MADSRTAVHLIVVEFPQEWQVTKHFPLNHKHLITLVHALSKHQTYEFGTCVNPYTNPRHYSVDIFLGVNEPQPQICICEFMCINEA